MNSKTKLKEVKIKVIFERIFSHEIYKTQFISFFTKVLEETSGSEILFLLKSVESVLFNCN